MADSFSKKENRKKKAKKQKERAQRREERKLNNNKGKGFEAMIAYVDQNGNLTDTPPDPKEQPKIDVADIQLGAAPKEPDVPKTGKVTTFLPDKGYGFITESLKGEQIFFHINNLTDTVEISDTVTFEVERTPKGYSAINVTLTQKENSN